MGRSPGGEHSNPLQYSCLVNPMDQGAWWAIVHGVAKSLTWLEQYSTVGFCWMCHWFFQGPHWQTWSQNPSLIILFVFSILLYRYRMMGPFQFNSVQSLSRIQLFVTPWTAARQASLSITNSWSLLKLMSIASVMPSTHLILCCPLLLLPSIFPSIRVFSDESALRIRWPKYWSFSFNISPSNEHLGLISFRMDSLDLFAVQGILKSLL